MQATKLVQWRTGKGRKSVLDLILQDVKTTKAQVIGIEFHKVIERIFHEDILLEIFNEDYPTSKIRDEKDVIFKLAYGSIENDCPYLPIEDYEKVKIAQAVREGMFYLLEYIFARGYDFNDVLLDPPYRMEVLMEKKITSPDISFYINGKIDLQLYCNGIEVADWKFKDYNKDTRLYPNLEYQLHIYEMLIGQKINSRKILFAKPNKIIVEEVREGNTQLIEKAAIEYQKTLDAIAEPLDGAIAEFETKWYENLDEFEITAAKSNNPEEVTGRKIADIIDTISFDPKLFKNGCNFCFDNCPFKKQCGNYLSS